MYIATINNGLSNQLKNLISVLRLSSDSKSKFIRFKDIFENDFTTLDSNIKYQELCTWRLPVFDIDEEIPFDFNINTKHLPESNLNFRDVDSEYERIPESFRQKILDIIKSFKIKKEILDVVNSYDLKNTIGCHVRTWSPSYHDEMLDWAEFFKKQSVPEYIAYFKNFVKQADGKIFLAVDDFRLKQEFEGDNIITYDRNPLLSNVQNDFIEMLLLGRCSIIYGTKLSTFTEMSWWFGGCSQPVVFSPPYNLS